MDDQNLYQAPQATVRDIAERPPEFFVVAPYKFYLLFFFTLGMYQLYWFYMQWARFKRRRNLDLWPAPRAIFAIFFAHSLNGEIEGVIERDRRRHRWSPRGTATAYVIFQIAMTFFDRLAGREVGSPTTDLISVLLLVPVALCLGATQQAANAACGDPDGSGNARLTVANFVWIVLGGLVWALYGLALFVDPDSL